MGKLSATMRLTRAEHSAMLVVAVLAAELIAGGGMLPSAVPLLASLVTPVLISMSAFAINDYFDVEVDRANGKRKAPLVSGELKMREALYITALCLVVGVLASVLINLYCFAIALVFGALAMLYSYRLKEVPLAGNAYIAFSMAIPFIYGSYAVNGSMGLNLALVTLMIFLSGLAREIHGTVRDLEGDTKARRVRSLPTLIGTSGSSALALLLYAIAILISIYLFTYVPPFAANLLFGSVIAVCDLLLAYVSIGYLLFNDKGFARRSRNLSLLAMALALVAILATAL